MTSTNNLKDFLKAPKRNSWCVEMTYDIYFRKSFRRIPGVVDGMVMCLDLAAINVHSDAPMGQGGFPALLSHIITCMATQGIRCLFVECVLNKGFEEHLVNKHGFLPMPTNTPEDVCLYKII